MTLKEVIDYAKEIKGIREANPFETIDGLTLRVELAQKFIEYISQRGGNRVIREKAKAVLDAIG